MKTMGKSNIGYLGTGADGNPVTWYLRQLPWSMPRIEVE